MTNDLPVRIVGERVVTDAGVGHVPTVWLPLHGQVIAELPPRKGNRRWLRDTVGIRSPEFTGKQWHLPRNSLMRLVTASIDRYGFIVLWRDMSQLSQCTNRCLKATGIECQCSCLGEHHGQDAVGWHERVGDVVVADLGDCIRTGVVYGARGSDANAVIYDGELAGERYCVDRKGRQNWPAAAQFMCASCITERASVWDHCHTHGFVRAPLCNRCNTRLWGGWQAQHGRAPATRNLDDSYYRQCPKHETQWRPCSA
ncbi:endonuclease VII domain-containing protein [Streptomyces sp. ASQP_92]|uniref:endonuclease VII domain-containing protein n=1 Tax=Streptomyces sp. ASQP_92 TaxID=2979116 RepID=UPI0021C1EFF8|nr:endonuclease VII domain-containing protein [Streptomyces sp. ASQP_92]MCT9087318.1 endonuclease VII domain-containing protein [Streptomyces sp. ASQP_92]